MFSGSELVAEDFVWRIYAVAVKNIPIALGFASITATQLALGVCMTTLAARRGGKATSLVPDRETLLIWSAYSLCSAGARVAQPLPAIPLDAYHLCVFYRHRALEVAYTSISLFYGALELLAI